MIKSYHAFFRARFYFVHRALVYKLLDRKRCA